MKFFFSVLLLTSAAIVRGAAEAPADPLPPGVVVAWAADDALTVRDQTGTRQVDVGAFTHLALAPDGATLAYATLGADGHSALWTAAADGSTAPRAVPLPDDAGPQVAQLGWLDADTLLFSTMTIGTLGAIPTEDLYRYDLTPATVTAYQVGGFFSAAPDGDWLVIARAGSYGDAPATLHLQAEDTAVAPVEVLAFPAVATGAHYPFYPAVDWTTDGRFFTAIPDADALYAEYAADPPPVTLYSGGVDGAPMRQTGTLTASLFGLPRWSTEGALLTYARRQSADPNRLTIYAADANGANPVEQVTLPPEAPFIAAGLTDGALLYYAVDSLHLIQPDTDRRAVLAQPGEAVLLGIGVTAGEYLFYAQLDRQSDVSLYLSRTEAGAPPLLIATTRTIPLVTVTYLTQTDL
ncbi:MAG: hypothetical protein ACOCXZ_01885 [Chloroflexota bacterium]